MNPAIAIPDESALVRRAAELADMIVNRQHRGRGDTTEAATRRAAREARVPERTFVALRYPYRWPKTIAAGTFWRLAVAAGEAIEERLEREIQLADAAGLNAENSAAYRFALAALGPVVEGAAARASGLTGDLNAGHGKSTGASRHGGAR